jgi:DNA-binding PadR family transcriptional regulator
VVVEVGDRPTADQGDPRRRYYRLSDRGHRDLAAELRRMERALVLARGVQLEPSG